jgi:MFS family permease
MAGFAGAAFVHAPVLGTFALGTLVLVGTIAFVLLAPDRSSRTEPDDAGCAEPDRSIREEPDAAPRTGDRPRPALRTMFAALGDHNFRWVFAGRLLVMMAYQVLQTRLLYFAQDRFGLGLDDAAATVAGVTAVSGVLTVVGLVASGPLSDRFGHRPFVYFGGALVGVGLLLVTQVSTEAQLIAAWGVVSLAFGSFVGVDGALAADVMPAADEVGKDIGVINLAQALPQTCAPVLGTVVLGATGGSYTFLLVFGAAAGLASVFAAMRLRDVR